MSMPSPSDSRSKPVMDTSAQIESYFTALAPDARRELEAIRETIRAAAPDAVESFSYNMPAFSLDGQPLLWYAAWRHHISLYPISEALAHAHSADLASYETTKGTVRFSRKEPAPLPLVARLVEARAGELRRSSHGLWSAAADSIAAADYTPLQNATPSVNGR